MIGRSYGFGIVGCGVIAPRHAAAIAACPGARLVAACDAVPGRAASFAAEAGCDAEPDLGHLLARPDVEVVSVCVPSGLHAEVGVAAARAGKHLVVEKPIDVTLAAADRLIEAVGAAGVRMTVISQRRFEPGILELRGLLASGALGRLVLGDVNVKWYRSQSYYDGAGWRGTWALDGGGALMNQGVHHVDLLRWCMGPVAEVRAMCATESHEIEVEDVALALLRFESGAVGSLVVTTAAYPGFRARLELHGTDGTAVVEDGELVVRELRAEHSEEGSYGSTASLTPRGAGPAPDTPPAVGTAQSGGRALRSAGSQDAHTAQLAEFLAALAEGREPLVDGTQARNALELVLAVYESARRGAPVRLPLA